MSVDINLVNYSEIKVLLEEKYRNKNITVFGAGKAGRIIASYIKDFVGNRICFCDNNFLLHDEKAAIPVYSVEKVLMRRSNLFFVGFLKNDITKLESAKKCLSKNGITNGDIIYVDMESGILDVAYFTELKHFIDSNKPLKRRYVGKVQNVCFLSYGFNIEKEKHITGGPSGAICMQKRYLKEKYREVKLLYPYYNSEKEQLLSDKFPHITDAIIKAQRMSLEMDNTIFIANDIFTAYGLYLSGSNYILLFHAQGDIVREMTMWGSNISEEEKQLFYIIEKTTVKNAFKVLFPSVGAEQYFRDSFKEKVFFNSGKPLYNTINEFPDIDLLGNIVRDENCITFLSVGQMTELKGMDRIPQFIEKYALFSKKKIRWICVADGVLKDQVHNKMEEVMRANHDVEFINIDYKITHGQIFYLMRICDVYLMLHRVSIFDFSTLEAMYNKRAIILSSIAGNDEFNKEDNIFMLSDNYSIEEVAEFIEKRDEKGIANYAVYQKYFSEVPFVTRYYSCIDEFIMHVEKNDERTFN